MKRYFLILPAFLLLLVFAPSSAQTAAVDSQAVAQQQGRVWAETRKPYFKNTRNDSLFVVNNGDEPFRYESYSQADNLGFFSTMFFSANVGDVVGPMFIEGYAVLYKIAGYDSVHRIRASHLYIKPDGKSRKDTLQAVKKANQHLAAVQKGADFDALVKKHSQDENAQEGGDLGWLWQGYMIKEFNDALANAKKGDVLLIKSPLGAHLVKITEDPVLDRGRVRVIPLTKRFM
jgi:parvulin-like peptidyl-prolyl isomerase